MTNRQTHTLEASMKRLTVWTCLLVLAVAGPAWSVPQINTEYGDQMPWLNSDINAMASTGAALNRGAMSNIFNPAFLAAGASNRLDAGLMISSEHEDRFQPLYDTFDNVVTDVSIASNRNTYWGGSFGLALHDSAAGVPITLALSLANRYPYSYTFEEEVRDPFFGSNPRDSIIEERTRKVTGGLRALSLGVGADLMDWLLIGGAVHYNFGTRTEEINQRFYTGDQDGLSSKFEQDMTGVNFTVGLGAKISERLEIGVAYENPLKASGTWNLSHYEQYDDENNNVSMEDSFTDSYYRYAEIFRGGFTFYPQTDPRTVFTADLEYVPWNKFEQNLGQGSEVAPEVEEANLNKVYDVRIGLEHTFYNGVPLRFGFRHFTAYSDKEAHATIFTGGTGVPLGSGLIGVSLELRKITRYQEHQFDYPEGYYTDPDARVEDTRFRVGVSYTVNW
jgi:hypothetical protein